MRLERLLIDRARATPDACAVRAADGVATYGALDRLANQIAHTLLSLGVHPGSRVCLWLDKSTVAVAVMQAVLRVGAAYVPLDPLCPRARIVKMLLDCAPTVLVTTVERAQRIDGIGERGWSVLPVDGSVAGRSWDDVLAGPTTAPSIAGDASAGDDAMAYILYTSGSTGTPKGVCISHRNALAFVRWAAATIAATADDRMSNHAPFHFDLSVLDLYVTFLVGARVSLTPTSISYVPSALVDHWRAEDITVWYSVPSALTMMMDQGGLLDDPSLEPRVLIFAGEAFPMPRLLELRQAWRSARFFNFFGPTETNVCTAYEVPPTGLEARLGLPIGTAASGDDVWLETDDGRRAEPGEVGEVIVAGPTVMLGYWGRPPQRGPYRTGDLARLDSDGQLEFHGRRDHLVKVRGHRIELGEIESVLQASPDLEEAAVAVDGTGRQARLIGILVPRGDQRPSLLAIKKLCAEHLPRYMIVDRIRWVEALPRTGNGKVDRARLLSMND